MRWVRAVLVGVVISGFVAVSEAQQGQAPQPVTIAQIRQRANELLNQTVLFWGLQQAYYERGETYFTERGIPANAIPPNLRGSNILGLVVRDFSGTEGQDTIFVIGDRKYVRPPESAYNPPPSSLWLVGGTVRRLRDILFVEVVDLGREPAWKGYQLLQWRHWLELLAVLIALGLLHAVLFLGFFNLTERPSGSVRAAYLLCLWALVGYLLLREPFRFFFAVGTIGFWVLLAVAGVLSLLLLLSLLLRGS